MIELIIVIVIIGLLAAMALPKFGNMTTVTANASAASVAGAMGSAASDYNAKSKYVPGSPTAVLTCVSTLALISGIKVADYIITNEPGGTCGVQHRVGDEKFITASITGT